MSDLPNSNWSETDASNSAAPPNGWPEGMFPSDVNNSARAMMGALKRWYKWSTPATTAGTSTAYTITYSVAPAALVDGMMHTVMFNAVNGATATLNVNGLGAIPLYINTPGGWAQVPAGAITANMVSRVVYDSGTPSYRILDLNAAGTWTPVDSSPASLTFSNVTGNYRIANGMVFAYFALTFPATANTDAVSIGGLPVTVPNQDYARIDTLINGGATASPNLVFRPDKNAAKFAIVNTATAGNSINSAWSGATLKGCIMYPVT
jgi:hypothetical protein